MSNSSEDDHYLATGDHYTLWIVKEGGVDKHHIFFIDPQRVGIFKNKAFNGETEELLNHFNQSNLTPWTTEEMESRISRFYTMTRYVKSDISKNLLSYIKRRYKPKPVDLNSLYECFYCSTMLSESRSRRIIRRVRNFFNLKYRGLRFSTDFLCDSCEHLLEIRDLSEYELKQKWNSQWQEIYSLYKDEFDISDDIWDEFENAPLAQKQEMLWEQAEMGFFIDEFEMVERILRDYHQTGAYDQFLALMVRLHDHYTEAFLYNQPYYVKWMIKIMYTQDRIRDVTKYFQYFGEDIRDIDTYLECINLIAFLGLDELPVADTILDSIELANKRMYFGDVPGTLANWYTEFITAQEYQKLGLTEEVVDRVLTRDRVITERYEFLSSDTDLTRYHLEQQFGTTPEELDIDAFLEHSSLAVNKRNKTMLDNILDLLSRYLMEEYGVSYLKCYLLNRFLGIVFIEFLAEGRKKADQSILYPWKNRYDNLLRRSKYLPVKGQVYKQILYVEYLPLIVEFLKVQGLVAEEHEEIVVEDNTELVEEIIEAASHDRFLTDVIIERMRKFW